MNHTVPIALIAGVMLHDSAAGQTMHWYWQVEVNGYVADTSSAIAVNPGDVVDIELAVNWEPDAVGFAASIFGINQAEGDASPLFLSGSFDNSEANGYGRKPCLAALSADNGNPIDSDGDGRVDSLDLIDTFSLPQFFGGCGAPGGWPPYPPPLERVYTMQWVVGADAFTPFSIVHGPAANGAFTNSVYLDTFGTAVEYDSINDELAFVYIPAPATTLALLPILLRRRRPTSH